MAAELELANNRLAYVYGVALHSFGHTQDALGMLRRARANFPADFGIGFALATILHDSGDMDEARRVAEDLQEELPDDVAAKELLDLMR